MKSTIMRITLSTILLFILSISTVHAATESRTALVIGNSAYTSGPLKNPVNDAADMAAMLRKLGFTVTLKQNAKQQEMDEAIREFGRQLKRTRGAGLFFYAGHGIQIGGVNYLLPVNARIEKESDVRFHSVNADVVLAEMENAENGINIVILDACRDNPYSRSFRNASRGLAIVSNAPAGTFISYSTGANQVARDGDGKNSPYTKALLENIAKPGLTITDVFMNVRTKVKQDTGQVPWELSSLEGRFYFNEQSGGGRDAAAESKRLDEERQNITQERELLEKQRALDEELEKLEVLKREQAKTSPPTVQKKEVAIVTTVTGPRETRRDGRFIAYENGTVLDTTTTLIWAAKDNGNDLNWTDAKSFCENYRGGGYTDWRVPTQDELAGLYDAAKTQPGSNSRWSIHMATELISITGYAYWASETGGFLAACFGFSDGSRHRNPRFFDGGFRALPVRSAK